MSYSSRALTNARELVPIQYGQNRELAQPNPREMPTAASFLVAHRKRITKPVIVEGMLLAGTFNMMLGRPFGGKSSCGRSAHPRNPSGGSIPRPQVHKIESRIFCLGAERGGRG